MMKNILLFIFVKCNFLLKDIFVSGTITRKDYARNTGQGESVYQPAPILDFQKKMSEKMADRIVDDFNVQLALRNWFSSIVSYI